MIVPQPKSKRAKLMSAGCRRPTWHIYVATMECTVPRVGGANGEVLGGPGWEFLFECEETGAQRRWGLEDRTPSSFDTMKVAEDGEEGTN